MDANTPPPLYSILEKAQTIADAAAEAERRAREIGYTIDQNPAQTNSQNG